MQLVANATTSYDSKACKNNVNDHQTQDNKCLQFLVVADIIDKIIETNINSQIKHRDKKSTY